MLRTDKITDVGYLAIRDIPVWNMLMVSQTGQTICEVNETKWKMKHHSLLGHVPCYNMFYVLWYVVYCGVMTDCVVLWYIT